MKSLLIANRGEIARRINWTARLMGLRTVAVYSDADAAAPFVREADQAMRIGLPRPHESYLDGDKILAAAHDSGADAIHPGYGFLSENADFAQQVLDAELIWVGAPPEAIRAMSSKDAAKRLMQAAGVPVTPGYLGDVQTADELQRQAEAIGYPILIKAVAGGGGRGMRHVASPDHFQDALASCKREAASSFGNDRVLLEKYIRASRHIEVQIFGDTRGNIVHLFERDCSLQRRHQKVIEETPAPGLDGATRAALWVIAVKAARAVNYVGAGTVEFIADTSDGIRPDRIWFMEMNTRLQVEHTVTEAITGEDLVAWQLRVAAGEALPKTQEELSFSGWAMEARLYAENPAAGFLPSSGMLTHLKLPGNVRVDSGVEQGDVITPYYDPMIAKLTAHAPTRVQAAAELAAACRAVEVWPVRTNVAFLARALTHPEFVAGKIDTGFIERHQARLIPDDTPDALTIAAAAQALLPGGQDPWEALTGFRVSAPAQTKIAVTIAGQSHVVMPGAGSVSIWREGDGGVVFKDGQAWPFGPPSVRANDGSSKSDGIIRSPMPGTVLALFVAKGERVNKGQTLLVLEAMKMENALVAPFSGVVATLDATVGAHIQEGTALARIEKETA